MDKYLIAFQDFIRSDKTYVEELGTRYHHEIIQVIQFLEEGRQHIYIYHSPSIEEFIDFMDGNGFIIDTTSAAAEKCHRFNPNIVVFSPEYTRECYLGKRKATITIVVHVEDEAKEEKEISDEWEPTQNPLGSRVQNIQITLEVGTADARPPP